MSTTSAELASSHLLSGSRMPAGIGLIAWAKTKATAYRKWRERRIAVETLRGFDDHLLRDIGVNRSEIMMVVHKGDSGASCWART